ncbi:aldehyde dehydrogenase family protein [Paraburkholderia sabiae]|uniref:Aldehyde dehydrogenase family protein n=1 Tax=Paraburkholderia sabiae TaxID=273251 RepID=A0ABU9QGM5_9BURK|nr:aldehyde dehydrogenase family protein [Paraburkholderia sabiae]WJZ77661.1 aldehyde dehydrogenase family protein [Paraburkholderia sabiae]CAD6555121.1 3-succinoylsemialdehyde-pyridine dehydrogenase [Paraburkholderia sabiae]
MSHAAQFYIDGRWVEPASARWFDLVDPSTEVPFERLALGNAEDVDRAVAAARRAFPAWSSTSVAERVAMLRRVLQIYERRYDEFAEAMRREMGAPITFARNGQAARGPAHLNALIDVLERFEFEEQRGSTRVVLEAIGVCGLITPWNWPVNQIVVKIAPALAAGCTMVLKPSEYSPLSALLFADVLHEAELPVGVFNLVNGDGPGVGEAIASHPDIDMVSFTGSTRAGVLVAQAAAPSVTRVAQELGGKSANILLDDVDLEEAVKRGVAACFTNSGQSCSIPTRMLVPRHLMNDAAQIAKRAAETYRVGPTDEPSTQLGPLVYGLAAYVQSADIERARKVGRALRAGGVHLNYPPADFQAPFGGYKRSGNGREWGEAGLREYLETKAMVGYGAL